MGLKARLAHAKEQKREEPSTEAGFLERIANRIDQGEVVPILSNSFRIEQIFHEEKNGDTPYETEEEDLTVEEQLTNIWASEIKYPLPDFYNLARVIQYHIEQINDDQRGREEYLEFLKRSLLELAETDGEVQDLAENLFSQIGKKSLPEIVQELGYPRYPRGTEDPLLLLAKLPLPVYMTTSHYDFLERALAAVGKKPITQACFWSGLRESSLTEHLDDPGYKPTSNAPLVYHFFGLEKYPRTLVLSEDDYMNFLITMARDDDTQNPTLPLILRQILANRTLLLMGYQLRDWDFRVLFRFIAKYRNVDPDLRVKPPRGMIIQLKPNKKQIGNSEESVQYLRNYFLRKQFDFQVERKQLDFHVAWNEAENFIRQLYAKWNEQRGTQS
jgi:hypothetical protein